MRAALIPVRFAWAMLFALLLTIHSLAPAGFMPAFSHGTVSIIACPDATDGTPAMRMGGARHQKAANQMCPYAAVSSLAALGPDWAPLLPVVAFALALLPSRTLIRAERQLIRDRPPVRGPPIPA